MSFDAVIVNWSDSSEFRTVIELDETEDVELRTEWFDDGQWKVEENTRIKVPAQRLEDVIAAMRAVLPKAEPHA